MYYVCRSGSSIEILWYNFGLFAVYILHALKVVGSHLQSQNVRLDKMMVCRSKYHAGTVLKNVELENNFRLMMYCE